MNTQSQDVFELPAYGCNEAARYIGLPYHTLRLWVSDTGLIRTPAPNILSWNNLAEAHVLNAMRKVHGLSMQGIRKALRELKNLRASQHPLLDESFETDGVNLCIREGDRVINDPGIGSRRSKTSSQSTSTASNEAAGSLHICSHLSSQTQRTSRRASVSAPKCRLESRFWQERACQLQ